jgi:hypothetical protein
MAPGLVFDWVKRAGYKPVKRHYNSHIVRSNRSVEKSRPAARLCTVEMRGPVTGAAHFSSYRFDKIRLGHARAEG